MNKRLSQILNTNQITKFEKKKSIELIIKDNNCPIFSYVNSLKSDNSKKTARLSLQAISRHLDCHSIYEINWLEIDRNFLNYFVGKLQNEIGLAPDTIGLYLSVIKSVLKEAYLLDLITTKQFERIKTVKRPLDHRDKVHHILTVQQYEKLLLKCNDNSNAGKRDAAIFAIIVGCGLRRFEAAKLLTSDINIQDKQLTVEGKGKKLRVIPLHEKTLKIIDDWLKERSDTPGPLFLRINKSDKIDESYLQEMSIKNLRTYSISENAIYHICKKRGLLNDLNKIPPHSLRRTYASWLYNNGADLKSISKLLGHNSVKTTEKYIIIEQDKLGNIVNNMLFD